MYFSYWWWKCQIAASKYPFSFLNFCTVGWTGWNWSALRRHHLKTMPLILFFPVSLSSPNRFYLQYAYDDNLTCNTSGKKLIYQLLKRIHIWSFFSRQWGFPHRNRITIMHQQELQLPSRFSSNKANTWNNALYHTALNGDQRGTVLLISVRLS